MIATGLISLMLALIGATVCEYYVNGHPNQFPGEKIDPDSLDQLRARWKALSFEDNVRRVSFSLISKEGYLVHTSPDKTELLFSRIDDYEVMSNFSLPSPCRSIDVNEKEKLLIACGTYDWSDEGSTFLYRYRFDANGLPVLDPIPIDLPSASSAILSPSGRYVALENYWNGSYSGIYRTADGSKFLNLSFSTLSFSPDEEYIAWTNSSYFGNVMTFPEGKQVFTFEGYFPENYADCLSWSNDGSLLAITNSVGVQVLDGRTFKVLNAIPHPENRYGSIISFSPDGKLLLIGYDGYCSEDESGYGIIRIMDPLGKTTYREIKEWTRGPRPYWMDPPKGLTMGEFPEYLHIEWKPDQSGFIVSSREYAVGGDLIHYSIGRVVIDDKVPILCFLPSFLSFLLIGGPIWLGSIRAPSSMVRTLAQRKAVSLLFLACSTVAVIIIGLSLQQVVNRHGWVTPFSLIDQANNLVISLVLSSIAIILFSAVVYLPGWKRKNFKNFFFLLSVFIGFFCMLMIGFGLVQGVLSHLLPDIFWVKTLTWKFDVADLVRPFDPWVETHSLITISYGYYGNMAVVPIWTVIGTSILLVPTVAMFRSLRNGLGMGRIRSGIGIALFTFGPVVFWFLSFIMLDRFYWGQLFPLTDYGENMSVIDWWPTRYYIQNPFGSALLIITLAGYLFIGIGAMISILPKGALISARIETGEKLSQSTRLLILEHLKNSPGAGIDEMVRDLKVSRGNIRYHLNILEKNGEIDAFIDGWKKIYELKRKGIPEGMDDLNLMIGAIEEFPGIDQAELTSIFGWSRSRVNRLLLELLSRGKILRMKDGKVWKYYSFKGNA